MKQRYSLRIIFLSLITLWFMSRKSDKFGFSSPSEDTRFWVKETYSKIDIMKLGPAFNLE